MKSAEESLGEKCLDVFCWDGVVFVMMLVKSSLTGHLQGKVGKGDCLWENKSCFFLGPWEYLFLSYLVTFHLHDLQGSPYAQAGLERRVFSIFTFLVS